MVSAQKWIQYPYFSNKNNYFVPIEKSASLQFRSDTVKNQPHNNSCINLIPKRVQGMLDIVISWQVTINDDAIVAEESQSEPHEDPSQYMAYRFLIIHT